MDVEHHIGLVQIHRAFPAKDVQGTGGVKLQGKGDLLGLILRLLQQFLAQVAEGSHPPGILRLRVHQGGAAVDDGFMLRPHAALVDLLDEGHDKLALFHDGVLLTVALHHIHGVEAVLAACHQMGHRRFLPAQGFDECAKFSLRVTDQDVVICVIWVEHKKRDQLLGAEGLARAGDAQQEGRLVQKVRLVAHDEVVGNGVLSKVNAALILDLLDLEGDEYGQGFRGEGTEGVDFPHPDGQGGVQAIKLLELEHRKLAHVLSRHGKHRFGIAVKLLLGVGGDGQGHHREHHPLVAGGEVIQKLLAFLALQFHIVGDHSREVVVGVLAALPVGDVGFHTQQAVFHLPHGLIRGNRHNVDGEHQISVEIGKLRHHVILNIRGVVFEEQHPAELAAQLQIVALFFDPVRADIVLEAVAPLHHLAGIEHKLGFLALAVEVVQDTQALGGVQLHALGAKGRKVGNQVGSHTRKIGAGLLNILLHHGDGDILFLHNAVGSGGFIQQHLVILPSVLVPEVPLYGHEDGRFKVCFVQAAVVDGDFRHRAGIQGIEQLRVGEEHGFLILPAGHQIVDVAEFIGFGELVPHKKNAVRPDTADGDHILHLPGDGVTLLFLLGHGFDGLNHAWPPSVC